MSEINKKWGVTDFVLERTCPEKHLNLSIKDVRARISNTDFFLKILPLKDDHDELVMSEM